MSDEQILQLAGLMEGMQVKANRIIVRIREHGDCMYLILSGEIRVSLDAENRETVLATLETGDFFGEIALFDEGPRSADIIANTDCTLLKISQQAFDEVLARHPEIAARFLRAIIRTVGGRVRKLNKKYLDSMLLARFWNRGTPARPLGAKTRG